jgi:hypothetical protein
MKTAPWRNPGAVFSFRAVVPLRFAPTIEAMGIFIFIATVFILLPLLLVVACIALFARYYVWGDATGGTIVGSCLRDGTDDDLRPAQRYYAVVAYSAGHESHHVEDGPRDQEPVVGDRVVVRYLRNKPSKALVWPGASLLWLAVPLVLLLWLAKRVFGGMLG